MNKLFRFAKGNSPCECLPDIIEDERRDTKSSNDALLDYIYGVNPETGLPIGDLSFYLGKDTRSEVRTFIETNLLLDMSNVDSSPIDFPTEVVNKFRSTITDDDIANFSRNHGETREEYASRIKSWLENERYRRIKEKQESDYKKN